MEKVRKYLAEAFGTMVLVLFGCGTAVVSGQLSGGKLTVLLIAVAFGLSIVAAAYAIGHISGCHVNPAVSLAMLINGKLSFVDFIGYVVGQVAGAFAGSFILKFIAATCEPDLVGLGANGYGELSAAHISMSGAIGVEIVLTFVFVLTILGVTSSEKTSNIAGIVIGLTLTFVHILGIPLTGTSVNPARSLAPAVFTGGEALSQVWVFILAPLAGAALAAVIFKFLFAPKAEEK
ncbi:MAG: aquaporin [Clostridia bacterium]|nr:aquaporin [Clostridia bacterium]